MSSSATGLGGWKKGGRVSDASAVTQNIRVVAQGQADATYAGNQKKNPFRMSQAVLNTEAYGGQVLSLTNIENLNRSFPQSFDAFINIPSLLRLNSANPLYPAVVGSSVYLVEYFITESGSVFCTTPTRSTESFVVRATLRLLPIAEGGSPGTGFSIGVVSDPTWVGQFQSGVGLITFAEGATPPRGFVIQFLTAGGSPTATLRTTAGTQLSTPTIIDGDLATALITNGAPFVVTVTYNKVSSTMSWVVTQLDGDNYTQSFGPVSGIKLNEFLGGSNAYIGVGAGTGAEDVQVPVLTGLTYSTFLA